MKITMPALAAAVAVLALSGCAAASPAAESSPTPTPPNPNPAACRSFETASNQLTKLATGGGKGSMTTGEWRQAKSDEAKTMDEAGLAASGDVKQRINDLMELMPADPTDLGLTSGKAAGQKYNAALVRVGTACSSEGVPIALTPMGLAPDWLTQ